ncbi:MAG TPA: hypothetical protein VFB20_08350 [Burkholderiales bacterium]|nr:hypothetical protein [Burkholderiales bacterium]
MRRFSAFQLALLCLGASLMVSAVFLDRLVGLWHSVTEPDAVQWNGLRVVPRKHQQIRAPEASMLIVHSDRFPKARLALFTRPEDGTTPRELVKALCRQDDCEVLPRGGDGSDPDPHRATAIYDTQEPLQIVVLRPADKHIWIEFSGPPAAYADFEPLIDSLVRQLGGF